MGNHKLSCLDMWFIVSVLPQKVLLPHFSFVHSQSWTSLFLSYVLFQLFAIPSSTVSIFFVTDILQNFIARKPTPLVVGWKRCRIRSVSNKPPVMTLHVSESFFVSMNQMNWHDNVMENNYRRTHTTVSLINYHFVFCPRYRRKIFLRHDV